MSIARGFGGHKSVFLSVFIKSFRRDTTELYHPTSFNSKDKSIDQYFEENGF